ncbi:MAG TPA: nicotinate phosphoribosyltransferase, partial [Methylomirabilota bacterium]|nr:nicotinate phosphoribosyltransferase [Methylomirabilota bacterium]
MTKEHGGLGRRPRKPRGAFASGPLVTRDAALFTDLYELTMAASYLREGMRGPATFSVFVRQLPRGRSFLVAAGLEDVLNFLRDFRYSDDALSYLDSLDLFEPAFLEHLRGLRFTGLVRAVPEGTVVFQNEPLLEITAPIIEAQLVETAVLNLVHAQTLLASKAVRCVLAARGRPVIEFGLRRTHGVDAGMKAARCAFIAGASMSSNVMAGLHYGITPSGTMAHSYVSAFPREIDAFRAFARAFPTRAVLVLDTYDPLAAARKAVRVAREMEAKGQRLAGVRLDSGDLVGLSRQVRAILDEAGLAYVKIVVSGGLDEVAIGEYLAKGAPIDAFGVGTRMDVSADLPYLDMAYKLVEYDGRPVLKSSAGKGTWAAQKQVYRRLRSGEGFAGDVLALREEPAPPGAVEILLRAVMERGRLLAPHPTLATVRDYCAAQVASLPEEVRELGEFAVYPVSYSERLVSLQRALEAQVEAA